MALPVTVAPAARDAAIASLSQLLGDRLSTAEFVREQHGKDASYHPCVPPDAVAFAQSTEEVSQIVKLCAEHKVRIIPFGSGHRPGRPCRGVAGRGVYRYLAADDMGKVAVFLASDDSSYVNGVELFADGGVAQY